MKIMFPNICKQQKNVTNMECRVFEREIFHYIGLALLQQKISDFKCKNKKNRREIFQGSS